MTDYGSLGSTHPFAVCWRNMLNRCYALNNNRFNSYGKRGIYVDPRWHTFLFFYEDMFASWRSGLQIDRINLNGPYSKENCRWVTPKENSRKRTTSKLTLEKAAAIKARFKPGLAYQKALAKEFGISDRLVRMIGTGKVWS